MGSHHHDSMVHGHEHFHVTHYLRHGEALDHLRATHSHEHDHKGVDHDHQAHEDAETEHLRESHVHDHGHPVE